MRNKKAITKIAVIFGLIVALVGFGVFVMANVGQSHENFSLQQITEIYKDVNNELIGEVNLNEVKK